MIASTNGLMLDYNLKLARRCFQTYNDLLKFFKNSIQIKLSPTRYVSPVLVKGRGSPECEIRNLFALLSSFIGIRKQRSANIVQCAAQEDSSACEVRPLHIALHVQQDVANFPHRDCKVLKGRLFEVFQLTAKHRKFALKLDQSRERRVHCALNEPLVRQQRYSDQFGVPSLAFSIASLHLMNCHEGCHHRQDSCDQCLELFQEEEPTPRKHWQYECNRRDHDETNSDGFTYRHIGSIFLIILHYVRLLRLHIGADLIETRSIDSHQAQSSQSLICSMVPSSDRAYGREAVPA